jgi:hypothetical protein
MKKLMFCILGLGILAVVSGCSHNPNKAEKIDTEMKNSGNFGGETVGVKDGNMVVQKKTLLSEELRDLQYEVFGLEDGVYGNTKYGTEGLYGVLKKCRLNLSDRKNGGDGKMTWTEPVDRVTDKEDDLKLGVDEQNKLVAISEEMIKDRIQRFREYKRLLLKRQNEYQDKVDICKAELNSRQYEMSHKVGSGAEADPQ